MNKKEYIILFISLIIITNVVNFYITRNYNRFKTNAVIYEAIKNDTNSAKSLYFQGELQMGKGNYKEAVSLFEQSMKLDPDFLGNYFRLARHYGFNEKNIDKADFYLKKAIEITEITKDTHPEKLYHAKDMYEKMMYLIKNQDSKKEKGDPPHYFW
jgi:tetratricopeptide (TPR) repeat protein